MRNTHITLVKIHVASIRGSISNTPCRQTRLLFSTDYRSQQGATQSIEYLGSREQMCSTLAVVRHSYIPNRSLVVNNNSSYEGTNWRQLLVEISPLQEPLDVRLLSRKNRCQNWRQATKPSPKPRPRPPLKRKLACLVAAHLGLNGPVGPVEGRYLSFGAVVRRGRR
jgi:hypothetical protein